MIGEAGQTVSVEVVSVVEAIEGAGQVEHVKVLDASDDVTNEEVVEVAGVVVVENYSDADIVDAGSSDEDQD